MSVDLTIVMLLCIVSTLWLYGKVEKKRWKVLLFIGIWLIGLMLSMFAGILASEVYDDSQKELQIIISYMSQGFWMSLIGCVFGAWLSKHKKNDAPSRSITKPKKKLHLDTCSKRLGVLLILLSASIFIVLSVHWNFTEQGFIDRKEIWGYIPNSAPDKVEGSYWGRGEVDVYFGKKKGIWYLFDEECQRKVNDKNNTAGIAYFDCATEKVEDQYDIVKEEWDFSSFNMFINDLRKNGRIGWIFALAVIGIAFVFGFADKVYGCFKKVFVWVRTGRWERKPKKIKSKEIKKTQETELPSKAKKFFYGTAVIILWCASLLSIKYSGIMMGGIPYGLIMGFWTWAFLKVTGMKMGFGNKD